MEIYSLVIQLDITCVSESGQTVWGGMPEVYDSHADSGLPAPALLQHCPLSLSDEAVCPCSKAYCWHHRERHQRTSRYICYCSILNWYFVSLNCELHLENGQVWEQKCLVEKINFNRGKRMYKTDNSFSIYKHYLITCKCRLKNHNDLDQCLVFRAECRDDDWGDWC